MLNSCQPNEQKLNQNFGCKALMQCMPRFNSKTIAQSWTQHQIKTKLFSRRNRMYQDWKAQNRPTTKTDLDSAIFQLQTYFYLSTNNLTNQGGRYEPSSPVKLKNFMLQHKKTFIHQKDEVASILKKIEHEMTTRRAGILSEQLLGQLREEVVVLVAVDQGYLKRRK